MSDPTRRPISPRRAARSPRLQAELDRIGEERAAAERQMSRVSWLELLRVCAQLFGSVLLGMAVMGMGLHVHDEGLGRVFWWGGMVVWLTGITWTLAAAYRRGEERGDW